MTTPTSLPPRRSGTAFTSTRRFTGLASLTSRFETLPSPAARTSRNASCSSALRMTSRNGLPSPRVASRPNIARARSFNRMITSRPSTAMTPSIIPSRIAVAFACSCPRSWIFSRSRRRQPVQRAAERADLIRRADRRPDREVALAHLMGDRLHLHDRLGHAAGHEETDPERDGERHQAAEQHHAVDRRVRRRHRRHRQGHPDDTDHPPVVDDRQRHIEQRRADRRARPPGAPDPAGEGREHLRPLAVVLDARQIVDGHFGIAQHAAVGRDHGDPRGGRPRASQHERMEVVRRGLPRHQARGPRRAGADRCRPGGPRACPPRTPRARGSGRGRPRSS